MTTPTDDFTSETETTSILADPETMADLAEAEAELAESNETEMSKALDTPGLRANVLLQASRNRDKSERARVAAEMDLAQAVMSLTKLAEGTTDHEEQDAFIVAQFAVSDCMGTYKRAATTERHYRIQYAMLKAQQIEANE